MGNQFTEKISIRNPIGNLYRKNHVLVLTVDTDGNFILGKKKNFYPDHIARLLGGGIKNDETPVFAAKREIEEELSVVASIDEFIPLCTVSTYANTTEGDMEMQTTIFMLRLSNTHKITAGDDISEIQKYTGDEYAKLIQNMQQLSGTYTTDKFSFLWSDWGGIYAPIHQYAIDCYKKLVYDHGKRS